MAHVLRLADISQSTTIDLLSGTMKLVDRSWVTQTTGEQYDYDNQPYGAIPTFKHFQPVQETMDLVGSDTSANVRSAVNTIEDVLEGARVFNSSDLMQTSYWLEWNADGESAKRSLIYTGALQYPLQCGINQFVTSGKLGARLTMTRHPLWESPAVTSIGQTGVSHAAGMWHITSIPGTAPARMYPFTATNSSGQTVYEFWAGIRPEYQGRSSFVPAWDAALGTTLTDTSVSSGAMYTTFATDETLANRFRISVSDVGSGDWNHFMGRYLVLGRVKTAATDTVVGIQLRAGFQTSGFPVPCTERFIDGRNKYHLMELGYVQIPPGGWYYGAPVDLCQQFAIEIWAEWIEGTKGLYVDELYLIPSQHFLYVNRASCSSATNPIQVYVRENDTSLVDAYWSGYPAMGVETSLKNWYLPVGNSVMVVAGQQLYDVAGTPHNTSGTIDLSISYYPRWRSYRDT